MAGLLVVAWPAAFASGQSVSVNTQGDALRVRAPGFGVIKGETLNRLKNGRTVRFDLALSVTAGPGGQAAAETRQSFVLSYDLWEERFAVTQAGTSPRSISHLKSADAEAWCLERLGIPLSALGHLGGNAPFWIRLEYQVHPDDPAPAAPGDEGYTLRGLIDRLSRRRRVDDLQGLLEAGPFRLAR